MSDKNILFVCSQNKLRSPTAENIFSEEQGFNVSSAGTNNDAVVRLSPDLIEWSDLIVVMEEHHRKKVQKKFKKNLNGQKIICLGIPDNFEFMQKELIELLKKSAGYLFE